MVVSARGVKGCSFPLYNFYTPSSQGYVLYKLPKMPESSNPVIRYGLSYLYMTSNTVDKGWQLSLKKISAKNSIPGNTLAPLYNESKAANIFWTLYNDHPPDRPINTKYGHAKGVIVANKRLGFWLIHSVPNYPPTPNCGENTIKEKVDEDSASTPGNRSEYDYPSSGKNYGQSFLCISMDSDQFDLIGEQLIYNQVTVFKKNIPDEYDRLFPTLADAARQKRIKHPPFANQVLLRSSGSVQFWSFAKSDKWQKELYDDFVAPTLNSDLFTETWLNGRGRLPSDCAGTKVYNILSISLSEFHIGFKSSHDHSKWAVAVENKTNQTWTCIGDINRADTQYIRGGGTVCFNVWNVWENYRSVVNDTEPCPK
ncbi:PREDICTED: plancitoxin-1 isoform X2 [Dinoponera quadriceps]|uniref:Plancitoxin-1 isoform X2 n=1 Tax=Dinoponera quadriceps TaxID=609295 RepID=A0A6P3XEG1_DINQU|nr:PREDICTED: plancitoxin-1 isoform X2 [Dinoponera quadriceps]XP_014476255.1 PREDICTED: plancitoxin-1 isoform X2 [Dinoponera quadriceps]XP_014476256.1 PREDICTED: plancitoxin-1 isoform X2 [Dinoponera quadriceps]XP_014476258.1 PREDICTED: plancitoxin-1 isoform X2 [Dinoponera quadriceps]XP_014476259.1 PREDICTED: plancitoxin-1 isoform X2 [Dinoponera quadriceps]XP_014476260.1 PREDICTED: plancitoxin-1 isoform X2 [Dinoponera quadriceps]